MKFIKVLSSVIFSLLIILAIGMYLVARHFDLNQYKSYVEDIVRRETGRELSINGEAKLAISLSPTVVINDVAFSNPDWAAQPQMIKVKQAEVKFALMPLLKKQIVIDRILLSAPEIYLQKADDGRANWNFGAEDTPQQTAAAVQPASRKSNTASTALLAGFAAKNVLIENGVVQYADKQTLHQLNIEEISLEIPSLDEQISLDFNVAYNGNDIKGKATLGSVNALLKENEAYPILLDVSAYRADLALNGSVVGLLTDNPVYAFECNLYNPAGNFGVPEATFKARIDGDVSGAQAEISALNLADNLITGRFDAKWNGELPQFAADLKSDKINLESLQTKSSPLAALPSFIGEAQALEISDDKVPYALLKEFNGTALLNVKQLIISPQMQANNVSVTAKADNGILRVNPLQFELGGGKINAGMNIDANRQLIDFELSGNGMRLQNLHPEFVVSRQDDFGILSGGDLDVYFEGTTFGATYRQLLGNLSGQVAAVVGKSEVQTGALEIFKGNILTQLLNVLKIDAQKTSRLDLTCAVVRSDIAGGKAVFPKGIAFDSKQVTIVSDGQINLLNDKLNFTIEPSMNKLASGNVTQALASFIKLSGTLEDPKLRIDDKEALKTLIGVAATGGASYLGSQVFLNGDGSPCYTALIGTPYADRFPKPTGVKATTQNVVDDTQKQLKQGLKDLKNTAKDILKSFQVK